MVCYGTGGRGSATNDVGHGSISWTTPWRKRTRLASPGWLSSWLHPYLYDNRPTLAIWHTLEYKTAAAYLHIRQLACMILNFASIHGLYTSLLWEAFCHVALVLLGFHQLEYHIQDDLGCQGTWCPTLSILAPFPVQWVSACEKAGSS